MGECRYYRLAITRQGQATLLVQTRILHLKIRHVFTQETSMPLENRIFVTELLIIIVPYHNQCLFSAFRKNEISHVVLFMTFDLHWANNVFFKYKRVFYI